MITDLLEAPQCTSQQLLLIRQHHLEWAQYYSQQRKTWQALVLVHDQQRAELVNSAPLEQAFLLAQQTQNILCWQRRKMAIYQTIRERQQHEMNDLNQLTRWGAIKELM
ncbi:hypothetical protein JYG30_17780 [Fibrella sp. USSR17]